MDSVAPPPTRAGYVLLAGLPNAGKSTLLNALTGEALSIVTPKAQTTWQRVAGIRSEPGAQMVFVDTPGLLTAKNLFQRSMLAEAAAAREEVDVAICVVDAAKPLNGDRRRRLFKFMNEVNCPKLFAINKIDVIDPEDLLAATDPLINELIEEFGGEPLLISADTKQGLDPLLAEVRRHLPESPFYFPADDVAQAPVRFFAQELVRETVFQHFEQEIPYSCAVQIDEFREDQDPAYVAATVFVERKSQKGMVVGKGGAAVRRLGADSRTKIEHFLGRKVYLDLWVKVADGWRRDREGLKRFGYRVPDDI